MPYKRQVNLASVKRRHASLKKKLAYAERRDRQLTELCADNTSMEAKLGELREKFVRTVPDAAPAPEAD